MKASQYRQKIAADAKKHQLLATRDICKPAPFGIAAVLRQHCGNIAAILPPIRDVQHVQHLQQYDDEADKNMT